MDRFAGAERSRAVLEITNFSAREFLKLFNKFREFIVSHWNCEKGKHSQHKPKNVYSMMLTVVNFGCSWDILAKTFLIKSSTFEQLIYKFVSAVYKHIYENLVVEFIRAYTVTELNSVRNTLKNFPYARYATRVTFRE